MDSIAYPEWLKKQIERRGMSQSSATERVSFSLLTTLYAGTEARFLSELRENVLAQTHANWEWRLLAHGPVSSEVECVLDRIGQDSRCHVERIPNNLGPMGGLRRRLEAARNDYVIALDADDLLTEDALQVMASEILAHPDARYLYSDEDHLFDGVPAAPFLRPDEDLALLTAGSYIWHLCAFHRITALELGVYTNLDCEWCHDWDTAWLFANAGLRLFHVRHVLYHWRHHASSSTNRPDPEKGSLLSQRRVLERQIRLNAKPHLFTVEEFPLFRGAFEWWIRRLPVEPPPTDLVVYGYSSAQAAKCAAAAIRGSSFPFENVHILGCNLSPGDRCRISDVLKANGGRDVFSYTASTPHGLIEALRHSSACRVVLCDQRVSIIGRDWGWEADKLFRLHAGVVAVTGRVFDVDGALIAGADVFGFDGVIGCPDAGINRDNPGYFATALKQRFCSAPYSDFFAVDRVILMEILESFPKDVPWVGLGPWLGGWASRKQKRVVYTPILEARAPQSGRTRMSAVTTRTFLNEFSDLLPDTRWYSEHFGWRRNSAYRIECS